MTIGCFALVLPFSDLRRQFEAIRELGIQYADLTDNHDGATLGTEFGFSASVSLDSHPQRVRDLLADTGLALTAVCGHANLLDPVSPDTYSTPQIIRAIKLAHFLGVRQVITTEGDPKTDFGRRLSDRERLFAIAERLYWPIRWAQELNVELLLEPHGVVTDSIDLTAQLLDLLGEPDTVGLNLDTGNLWLGGGDPVAYVRTFGRRIRHVHWKDLPGDWLPRRGTLHGCGMATIPLGQGVVGIDQVITELSRIDFDGPTTLEVTGAEAVRKSAHYLRERTT